MMNSRAVPLRSWLLLQGKLSLGDDSHVRAAEVLLDRATAQGLHLLLTDDPWFFRRQVESSWQQHPETDRPPYRMGVDPAFGDRPFLAIIGVNPELPMVLLSTNAAMLHKHTSLSELIEEQRLWSDWPRLDRRGIGSRLITNFDRYETNDIVHCGAMWVTPSLRGRRSDGVPLAAHLAPLLRLCVSIEWPLGLIISTVADRRLTKTVSGREAGEIVLTHAGQEERQALHVYDADDMRRCAEDVFMDA